MGEPSAFDDVLHTQIGQLHPTFPDAQRVTYSGGNVLSHEKSRTGLAQECQGVGGVPNVDIEGPSMSLHSPGLSTVPATRSKGNEVYELHDGGEEKKQAPAAPYGVKAYVYGVKAGPAAAGSPVESFQSAPGVFI